MNNRTSQGAVDERTSKAGVVDEPEFREEGQGKDGLELTAYYEALAEFIRETETPMTVGIQGKWGSGKTTLMNHIWKELNGYEQSDPNLANSTISADPINPDPPNIPIFISLQPLLVYRTVPLFYLGVYYMPKFQFRVLSLFSQPLHMLGPPHDRA